MLWAGIAEHVLAEPPSETDGMRGGQKKER